MATNKIVASCAVSTTESTVTISGSTVSTTGSTYDSKNTVTTTVSIHK